MKPFLFTLLYIALTFCLDAQPRLSSYFTDNMVIQREAPIIVDGFSTQEAEVNGLLESLHESYVATAKSNSRGGFDLHFPPIQAGGPFKLTVTDSAGTVSISSILIGDVWICAGQSNMEWRLHDTEDSKATIESSHHPYIRLFKVPHNQANYPVESLIGGPWSVASPDTTKDFSAVGYYFGREIANHVGVPIGLVSAPWGGTSAEIWIHSESFQNDSEMDYLLNPSFIKDTESQEIISRVETLLNSTKEKKAHLQTILQRQSNHPISSSIAYNGMIHPLTRYPIKGVIWYQGEANADRAEEYQDLFPLLIKDWRRQWNDPDLPFYFVQLANFNTGVDDDLWAELREAQEMALQLPFTGMATAIDIGNSGDIHPRNKIDVGHRLALNALSQTYGLEIGPINGPTLKSATPKKGRLVLEFENIAGGLELKLPTENAFEIASKKGTYHPAKVVLEHDKIILSSPEVARPKHARYAWANDPETPLYNSAKLPALPFRTDKRPLASAGKRYNLGSTALTQEYRYSFLNEPAWTTYNGIRIAASTNQEGNPIENAFDDNTETRWSTSMLGALLVADLGNGGSCDSIGLNLFRGDQRQLIFRVEGSTNGKDWEELFFGLSAGTSENEEIFELPKKQIRYLLLSFYGNTSNTWNSITEIEFYK